MLRDEFHELENQMGILQNELRQREKELEDEKNNCKTVRCKLLLLFLSIMWKFFSHKSFSSIVWFCLKLHNGFVQIFVQQPVSGRPPQYAPPL